MSADENRGYHTSLLRPWVHSEVAQEFSAEAGTLSLKDAQAAILEACLHSAVVAPEQEARKWLPFAPLIVEELVSTGRVTRLRAARNWLTIT
jgi:hypothetical protein